MVSACFLWWLIPSSDDGDSKLLLGGNVSVCGCISVIHPSDELVTSWCTGLLPSVRLEGGAIFQVTFCVSCRDQRYNYSRLQKFSSMEGRRTLPLANTESPDWDYNRFNFAGIFSCGPTPPELLWQCDIHYDGLLTDLPSSQILILDQFTTKLLSSCCKMSDLMSEKITSRSFFHNSDIFT